MIVDIAAILRPARGRVDDDCYVLWMEDNRNYIRDIRVIIRCHGSSAINKGSGHRWPGDRGQVIIDDPINAF